jgi:hypothetical protein
MMNFIRVAKAGEQAALHILRLAAWAPGVETGEEWIEWALGKREIQMSRESPGIEFTEPLFRRRLSQSSKMTIQVIHYCLPLDDTKIVFLSFRGELARQYKINKMLIEDRALMPAAFSLSVFNAPAALASIALNLESGYSAVYPAQNSFASGLAAAFAPVLCGTAEKILLVYADEAPPPEYSGLYPEPCEPLAFGILVSRNHEAGAIPLVKPIDSPRAFLSEILLSRRA